MNWKQKDYLWISIITGFYLATGLLGVYDIGQLILWPIFALPMTFAGFAMNVYFSSLLFPFFIVAVDFFLLFTLMSFCE